MKVGKIKDFIVVDNPGAGWFRINKVSYNKVIIERHTTGQGSGRTFQYTIDQKDLANRLYVKDLESWYK